MPEPIIGLHHVTAIASGPQRRSAAEMIKLGNEIGLPGIALLAPQAPEHTWYLNSFLVPLSQNEPWLTSALHKVQDIVEQCAAASSRIS